MSEFERKDEQEQEQEPGGRMNEEAADEVEGHVFAYDESPDDDETLGRRRR
ncbi:MAG: hypothetical protein ICV64_01515 [Thermoleophilia bacterium]|nr:hypothetical protein [Thermoleophilia bacterium]